MYSEKNRPDDDVVMYYAKLWKKKETVNLSKLNAASVSEMSFDCPVKYDDATKDKLLVAKGIKAKVPRYYILFNDDAAICIQAKNTKGDAYELTASTEAGHLTHTEAIEDVQTVGDGFAAVGSAMKSGVKGGMNEFKKEFSKPVYLIPVVGHILKIMDMNKKKKADIALVESIYSKFIEACK